MKNVLGFLYRGLSKQDTQEIVKSVQSNFLVTFLQNIYYPETLYRIGLREFILFEDYYLELVNTFIKEYYSINSDKAMNFDEKEIEKLEKLEGSSLIHLILDFQSNMNILKKSLKLREPEDLVNLKKILHSLKGYQYSSSINQDDFLDYVTEVPNNLKRYLNRFNLLNPNLVFLSDNEYHVWTYTSSPRFNSYEDYKKESLEMSKRIVAKPIEIGLSLPAYTKYYSE